MYAGSAPPRIQLPLGYLSTDSNLGELRSSFTVPQGYDQILVSPTPFIIMLGCYVTVCFDVSAQVSHRLRSAQKAFFMDIQFYTCKDIPFKEKCQRLVTHVYPAALFASCTFVLCKKTMNHIITWDNGLLRITYGWKKKKDESYVDAFRRAASAARDAFLKLGHEPLVLLVLRIVCNAGKSSKRCNPSLS